MISKQFIQNYFNADFTNIDSVLNDVLVPIFGDYNHGFTEITVATDKAKEMAKAAHIKTIKHVATFEGLGLDIKVFDVTLDDRCHIHQARKNIQALVRQFVEKFEGAFIIFHYEDPTNRSWRLSYLEKRETAVASTNAKRYTYLCGQQYPCRTLAERFDALQKQDKTAANLEAAFSVEALSNEFFDEYRNFYQDLVNFVKYENNLLDEFIDYAGGNQEQAEKYARDYIKKLMGRLVFIQFLQNKAWLNNDIHYTHTLFNKCSNEQKENFLDNVLEPLFFGVFNTPKEEREQLFHDEPWDMNLYEEWKNFPYLNGGLFECDELDKLNLPLPSYFFSNPGRKDHVRTPKDECYDDACGIFDFFDRYNFTIDESDPLDTEVGVDPEMLGKIFENLLEDNKDKGAFYTPKEIVQYMCKEALIAYLIDEARHKSEVNKQRQENFEDAIRAFVNDPEMTVIRMQKYGDQQLIDLNESLCSVKICDPAIGSGAFPMGLLNLLMNCRIALNDALGKGEPRAWLKKEIIQNNIYGVDIEKGAIDIARLRFWLSIVVDLEDPEALPNFDYKFMQGNSLLEQFEGRDLSNMFETTGHGKKNLGVELIAFDEVTSSQAILQEQLHHYFSMRVGDDKHLLRQKVNDAVVNLIKENVNHAPAVVDKLNKLDVSANTDFFLWHTWFADVFSRSGKEGFDIVIGNPPYLKEGRISKVFFDPYKNSPYYMGKMDIWYMFACFGIDLLHKHGHLCFIATNNWTTNYGAGVLRNKIIKDTRICQIVDFGALMMFDSASIQTMIMLLQKDSITDDYSFDYRKSTHSATEKDAINILKKQSNNAEYIQPIIRRNNYIDSLITFSNNDFILNQIQSGHERIFLEENELTNGIHPHFDFVNKKLAEKYNLNIGEGIFGLSSKESELLELTNEEKELIKPYYNSSINVERFFVGRTDLSIIYTPSSFKNPHSMDNFPHLKKHLDKYTGIITSDNKPYGLHRARVEDFFIGEKVVALRKCAVKPLFAYANGDNYMSATFYIIKTKRLNMKYLTGVLNSKIIEFWLRNKGKMQGEIFQLDKEPLMHIPIANSCWDIQNIIATLVDAIILLKRTSTQIDSHVSNEYIAKEYEKMINGCVFEIYFEDEVKKYCGESIISTIRQHLPLNISLQNILGTYSSIESTGVIELIDSFSLSNSEILRTISLE